MGGQKKVKVEKVKSPYEGVGQSTSSFGNLFSTTSRKNGGQLENTVSLGSELQGIQDTGLAGAQKNLNILSMSPDQRYQDALAGNNMFYNAANERLRNDYATVGGNLLQANARRGLTSSSVLGAAQGALASDLAKNREQQLTQALVAENQLAGSNLNSSMGAAGRVQEMVQPYAMMSNADLARAMQSQQEASALNARNSLAASQANASRKSGVGGGVGTLLGAGLAAALAIPTGGMSLAAAAPLIGLGGALGGSIGGMFDGSPGAGAALGSYLGGMGGMGGLGGLRGGSPAAVAPSPTSPVWQNSWGGGYGSIGWPGWGYTASDWGANSDPFSARLYESTRPQNYQYNLSGGLA